MNERKTFKVVENNIEIECEILYTFKLMKTNKDYIIYTDNAYDENNKINVYASIYYPFEPNRKLEPVETEDEWTEIENFLNRIQN